MTKRRPTSMRARFTVAAVGILALGLVITLWLSPTGAPASSNIFGAQVPSSSTDPDTQAVELGVKFSSDVSGVVEGVRFYKGPANIGTHVGSLWSSDGHRLAEAQFSNESATGWQTVTFANPVQVTAHATYVASYLAPSGRYAGDQGGFDKTVTSGHLTVPAGGGVYRYGRDGGFPDQNWRNSNYYVDVVFQSSAVSNPQEPLSSSVGEPTHTSVPSSTATSATPSGSGATTSGSATTTSATTSASAPSQAALLDLPRVAWEGGPSYYQKFPQSAGYTDPNVFPIAAWWADFDSDANVKWDKDHGINTYVQLNGAEDGRLLSANHMFWIGDSPLKNMTNSDSAWVGWWLSDELDGRTDATAGLAEQQRLIDAQAATCPSGGSCRFDYSNYTGIITSDFNADQKKAAETYVNMYDGPVSVDGYYYTDQSCDNPQHVDYQHSAPDQDHCRAAANYGNFIKTLRLRDSVDGKLKPLWGFVENGAPGGNSKYITPDQMRGAAWSMIINEARGLVWFNQSFSGNCVSGNVIRSAQADPSGCNAERVAAMKSINGQIQSMASILNTQSYQWTFGKNMDTMLKAKDGYAYIFSEIGINSDPGSRSFQLPNGISGSSAEVVGENRSVAISNGSFTDTFDHEYTPHIYKIKI